MWCAKRKVSIYIMVTKQTTYQTLMHILQTLRTHVFNFFKGVYWFEISLCFIVKVMRPKNFEPVRTNVKIVHSFSWHNFFFRLASTNQFASKNGKKLICFLPFGDDWKSFPVKNRRLSRLSRFVELRVKYYLMFIFGMEDQRFSTQISTRQVIFILTGSRQKSSLVCNSSLCLVFSSSLQ